MTKFKTSIQKYRALPVATGLMTVVPAFPAMAADTGTGTLTGTLAIFSEVFAWFLEEGANLLSWMLDKPIILCSLAIFFAGSVIGILKRVYNAF